ncbi:O-succinylbenzoic acid--CoA ligase [Lysinibacillus xylanilyticus]|uniref:2-succinylbenzoate--CoA ligase n=1 Tax=Lysinibacillus xylanilyticus TaxID=582475 RepID=A0A0K9F7D5_9BACI|nr:o-succinylbenzoate--CoA ligase [Lysinibacillus xylanilyticus]KMY30078.1 O-succinylbenzoic acid--CoA ligase [Lysinibacillus xylanilyticus]
MYLNWILQRAYLTPLRNGLTYNGQTWTFQELNDLSLKRARQLTALDIKQGDRIAIMGPSKPSLVIMMYACMHLQCEMVMLNRRLTQDEIAYQLEDSGALAVLIADEDIEKLPSYTSYYSFSTIEKSTEAAIDITKEWSLNQTTSIMYTSGTTGFPKGVCQTVGNHQASATASVLNIGLHAEDIWICAVPLFHISGFSILVRSLLYGNKVHLYDQFDAEAISKNIRDGEVTHMSVVAVTLERILHTLEQKNAQASSKFKMMLAGGGPVPVDYLKRAQALNLAVAQTYGMTETSSQTATLANEDAMRKIGSAGKPLFFNQIRIAEPNDNGEGEICIRGPHVTPGYIGRFAQKNATIDGWLHTGDIGYIDEEGYLFVIDRRADLIISGGENIYPAEIENVLLTHPAVKEAGVCGIDDEAWGQVPIAFVVLKEEVQVEQIQAFCQKKLAKYKIPKEIVVTDELPRNGANKLLRRKLMN